MADISLDDLLAEYQRLGPTGDDDDGLTVAELSARWSLSHQSVRALLRRFNQVGWLVTGRKTITSIAGQPCRAPCYKIVVPDKKKSETKKIVKRR